MKNNCKKIAVFAGAMTFAVMAMASEKNIGVFDPLMAEKGAVVVTNGVKWIDGKILPLEGRAFDDTEYYYDRLPAGVTTNVNGGVRYLKHHTTGMMFRFVTDSRSLRIKWVPFDSTLAMDHMPATGVSGIDVYRYDFEKGKWLYAQTGRIFKPEGGSLVMGWTPGTPCLVNLPLYNGIREFSIGVDPDALVRALGPRKSGIDKPVVFYGTSITQGGCASRPGLSFVNIVGRKLDVPVVNLGFSGSGVMEYEMSEHIARIDASCYVLDCLSNMGTTNGQFSAGRNVETNYEPFIHNLRAKRPDVPILMAEQRDVFCGGPNEKDKFTRRLYERLIAEGWKKLYYLPKDGMFSGDLEGTVDSCHPNDLGMMTLSEAYGRALSNILK